MDCAVDCCIDCYTTIELVQIWIKVSIVFTVRIISLGLKLGPTGIIIVITISVVIYFTFFEGGGATAVSGNTIEIGKERYRIYGVAALMPNQPLTFGNAPPINGFVYCRNALTAKIGDRKVRCREYPDIPDPLQRTVAKCSISQGVRCGSEDLGRWLVRNGYAIADVGFMHKHPIDNGAYAAKLLSEEAFAEKHRLGIHAGKFARPRKHAQDFLSEKWKEKGLQGEPTFDSLEELVLKLELEWQGEVLVEISGEIFGDMDLSDLALAAVGR